MGLKVAKLVRDGQEVMDIATQLKYVADEVTDGGVDTGAEEFQVLFGLESSGAGSVPYSLLQSIMAGSLVRANLTDFDQGI